MKLCNTRMPYVRVARTVPFMMRDMILALLALLILPAVSYGTRPLVLAGVSALTCAVCELLFSMLQGRSLMVTELSCVVTGLLIALLMPVNAPLWLPCAASAFAILVAKGPFGFFGNNPFNPAAAGMAFAVLCWPDLVFTYLDPEKPFSLPAFGSVICQTARSPAAVLKDGLKPEILPLDLLWGNTIGAVGTTGILVIGACGLFLMLRRTVNWETTACFLAAAAALAALYPRILCSPLTSVKYELLSGSLLFGSVFMVTDPVTSPHTVGGRCVYGALAGALTMLFRRFGVYEQGLFFALLIMNALAPLVDTLVCRIKGWEGRIREP